MESTLLPLPVYGAGDRRYLWRRYVENIPLGRADGPPTAKIGFLFLSLVLSGLLAYVAARNYGYTQGFRSDRVNLHDSAGLADHWFRPGSSSTLIGIRHSGWRTTVLEWNANDGSLLSKRLIDLNQLTPVDRARPGRPLQQLPERGRRQSAPYFQSTKPNVSQRSAFDLGTDRTLGKSKLAYLRAWEQFRAERALQSKGEEKLLPHERSSRIKARRRPDLGRAASFQSLPRRLL